MVNYVGNVFMMLVAALVITFGLLIVIHAIFKEVGDLRERSMKPFNDSLNAVLKATANGVNAMIDLVEKENKANAELDKYYKEYKMKEDEEE